LTIDTIVSLNNSLLLPQMNKTQMDDWYELLNFHATEDGSSSISSITADFMFGVEWRKE
jgi:hypothetical protein